MPQHISKKKISFHKTPTGGGHRFMKLFRKIDFFLKDGFPKMGIYDACPMHIAQWRKFIYNLFHLQICCPLLLIISGVPPNTGDIPLR